MKRSRYLYVIDFENQRHEVVGRSFGNAVFTLFKKMRRIIPKTDVDTGGWVGVSLKSVTRVQE